MFFANQPYQGDVFIGAETNDDLARKSASTEVVADTWINLAGNGSTGLQGVDIGGDKNENSLGDARKRLHPKVRKDDSVYEVEGSGAASCD